MKFSASAALLAAVLCASSAFAADTAPAKPLTPQQQKMKDCNAEAKSKGLQGKEYTEFRNTCLKGNSAAAAPVASAKPISQTQKMKNCNINAKNQKLEGDARKTYMSTCLKGDGSVVPATAN
jgi:hypothetical protein